VSATKPPGERGAPARQAAVAIRVRVVVAMALLIVFSIVGGFGVMLNDTRAILVGWLGFALVLLIAYVTRPARPGHPGQPASTDGA
jgi:hypothetical protein